MNILSVYWGICSSAALYQNGAIVAATHEERFSRVKNDDAFPSRAIEFCLSQGGISAGELDKAVVASLEQDYYRQLMRAGRWHIDDYLREQREYWRPILLEGQSRDFFQVFGKKADFEQYPQTYWHGADPSRYGQDRASILAAYLGLPEQKAERIEHHTAHAYYSYYASPFRGEPILAFTVDGHGDGLNASIGIFDAEGRYRRVYATNTCNIARIYRYMTLLLGMKPNEHEYKVMGLAPYGKESYALRAYEVFSQTLDVEGVEFCWRIKPSDSYYWFKERLEGLRFDSIAWGLQKWVEDLLCRWVDNAIRQYGIGKIVLSGGVAMNIKAMGEIAKLENVQDIFVGGSAGDESLAISSALCCAEKLEIGWNAAALRPIPDLYLGPEASREQEAEALSSLSSEYCAVVNDPTTDQVAALLASGKVLARCVGRMEFGQRALGNRSILADPANLRVKETINRMVKNRDFWMPFAPVLLDGCAQTYLKNPKGLQSPYMTLGFETTAEGFEAMIAACHPADTSARPQILSRSANPGLYALLEAFEKLTGRGSLLNTSFNLHGHPIVNTPAEAVYVLENSGLDGLLLNHFLIQKKR